ncbi:MAG TPA: hypothetical protein VHB20_03705 [Verrucomicrobiae bacterium]|jgi:hypothetical protein|nr:hypothetical protein [Verrucomicrobiae bacterium]
MNRRTAWIFASFALVVPGALAWNCTTCDQFGSCVDGSWIVTQDVWGAAANWQQCLSSDSHSHWQIAANLKGQQWVGSYPHANYTVNQALGAALSNSTPLMAAWNATYPTDHKFDFAYDLWLNGTTYEVMIWLNWNNTAPIGGNPFTNATINGITYSVYEGAGGSGPHCISFLPQNGMMDAATNYNLCGILGWINNLKWNGGPGGYYWKNPNFDSVQLGWEICDTYGAVKTYTMNSFNVYYGQTNNSPPVPTLEQAIWQADFDNAFPNGGGYGFTYRDGSPAATGILSTNRTGGTGQTAALEYTVDLSSWNGSPPVSYSGFGSGVTESPLAYRLTNSNKGRYRLYLSAKVGGVSAGVTNVPAQIDLNFFTPGGTQVYDLTAAFSLTTSWQSFVFDGETDLQVATWLAGAQQLFNQNVTNVNHMEVQLTVEGGPNVAAPFGYDANNSVELDDIKVVQLIPGLAPVMIGQSNGQTQLVWADPTTGGTAKLQCATNITGPYFDVPGAGSAVASPYPVTPGARQFFFRTAWTP